MKREDLHELHYITPIENVASIMANGLLSHNGVQRLGHARIDMREAQDRRAPKRVPNGLPVHDYVNLYICARNPMLYKRRGLHERICVLAVAPDVLDLPGAVVADQNVASNYVRFAEATAGLAIVDRDMTVARNWTHPLDQIAEWRHKAMKCAEILVPNRVDANYIVRAYVSGEAPRVALIGCGVTLPVEVTRDLFFL